MTADVAFPFCHELHRRLLNHGRATAVAFADQDPDLVVSSCDLDNAKQTARLVQERGAPSEFADRQSTALPSGA